MVSEDGLTVAGCLGDAHRPRDDRRERLLGEVRKPLSRIRLGDLHTFNQSLIAAGLAPISRARTLAAIKSLFGFCQRMRFLAVNPAAELLPRCELRLNERCCPRRPSSAFWRLQERPWDAAPNALCGRATRF